MLDSLVTLWNVLLVLVGFGFVIFWHELGHFLAARWAKIRVMEFAVGFGPAIVAYRKGVGVRRGSTNPAYQSKLDAHRADLPEGGDRDKVPGVSQTEYRLNWIPLGGYVRMLGQEDANPSATSDAPDSYGSVAVWKRLIVVSGGVIMNVILAAILFVVVYAVGLESNAPAIEVQRGSVAERAGLETGDVVRTVNGKDVEVFQDLLLKVGLSKKGEPVVIEVERDGELTTVEVEPEYNEDAQIRAIGVYAMSSATVVTPDGEESLQAMGRLFASFGMGEVQPGWTLVGIDNTPNEPVDVSPWGEILLPTRMLEAARTSEGRPIPLSFETTDGETQNVTLNPAPEFDRVAMEVEEDFDFPVEHLLGLTPPMLVREVAPAGEASGLVSGDVFVRLGDVDWPNVGQGVRTIRTAKGSTINAVVLRDGRFVELELAVDNDGLVGFTPGGAFGTNYLSAAPEPAGDADEGADLLLIGLGDDVIAPGTRLTHVGGTPVSSLIEARAAMIAQTSTTDATTVELRLSEAVDVGAGRPIDTDAITPGGEGMGEYAERAIREQLRIETKAVFDRVATDEEVAYDFVIRRTDMGPDRPVLFAGRLSAREGTETPKLSIELKGHEQDARAMDGLTLDGIFDGGVGMLSDEAFLSAMLLDEPELMNAFAREGSTLPVTIGPETAEHLHTLGWNADDLLRAFAPATVLQVGDGPGHSLALGLRETQRMLTRVYLTLGRLADGSVKPEQLKGPVGITHIGSRVAREGWVRLLFFIGLISANLAVLNFLPLPIVDGGLFLLLCYEGVRGKPAPVAVQNALTLIGLVLIAAVFIFVTTNDVLNLFG